MLGKLFANRPTLHEAQQAVEDKYRPMTWSRLAQDKMTALTTTSDRPMSSPARYRLGGDIVIADVQAEWHELVPLMMSASCSIAELTSWRDYGCSRPTADSHGLRQRCL